MKAMVFAAMMAVVVMLGACALLPKSEPVERHFFSPETIASSKTSAPDADAPRLRLGHVTATSSLRQPRIVYRESRYELGEHDNQRWTDDPAEYARRALVRSLFADARLKPSAGGAAPVLDVELLAFEEVKSPTLAGAVEMSYTLSDGADVLAVGRVRAERPAQGATMAAIVAAIAAALDRVADELAERVRTALVR